MSRGFDLKFQKNAQDCLDFKYMGFDGKEIEYYDLAWEIDKSDSDFNLNRIRGAEYILFKP